MKQLITIILIISTLIGFSQDIETNYLNCSFMKCRKKKALFIKKTEIKNNISTHQISFLSNGNLHKTISLNKVDGKSKETIYWNNGKIRSITNLKIGEKYGLRSLYYWNGNIKSEIQYKNDLKEGNYKKFDPDGTLETEGFYKNGKKQGTVKSYNYYDSTITYINYMNNKKNGSSIKKDYFENILDSCNYVDGDLQGYAYSYYSNGIIKAKRFYVDDKRNGDFENYWKNGVIKSIKKYKNDTITSEKYFTNTGKDTVYNETKKFTIVEEMAEFVGGHEKLFQYLAKNIKYTQQAKECGIMGKVYVQFVVEKDGSLSNIELMRGIGSGCDEVALEAIKNMPNWNPSKQKGEPVRSRFVLPVNFVLR